MKKLFLRTVPLIFLSFLFVTTSPASTGSLGLGNITLKKMNFADKESSWYRLACTVTNPTDHSGLVGVKLQSIDKWAFKRKAIRLYGHVNAGGETTLTLKSFMDSKTFDDIRNWEVASIAMLH